MAGSASERLTEPTDFIRKALGDMGADVMGFADFARYDREIVALGEDVSKKYPHRHLLRTSRFEGCVGDPH